MKKPKAPFRDLGQEPDPEEISDSSVANKSSAFSNIQKTLADGDLKNPAIAKMLLEQLDLTQKQLNQIEPYRQKYFEAERSASVYKEKFDSQKTVRNLYTLCIAAGGALLGL